MKLTVVTLLLTAVSCAVAQQEPGFDVPSAYSVDRYEAGWNTNPFTLKTAAAAVEKISSFKDLTLASMYQHDNESYVTLINIKTRERIRLTTSKTDPNGMRIKSANILPRRSDSYAEIAQAGETAVLRYDEKMLAQLTGGQGHISQGQGGEGVNPVMADMMGAGGNSPGAGLPPGVIPAGRNRTPLSPTPGQIPMSQNSVGGSPPNSGNPSIPNRDAQPTRRRLLTAPRPPSAPPAAPPPGMLPPVTPP